jgi:hypothetical protein
MQPETSITIHLRFHDLPAKEFSNAEVERFLRGGGGRQRERERERERERKNVRER